MTLEQPAGTALRTAPGGSPRAIPVTPMRALPSLMRKLWTDRLALMSDAADEYGDAVRFRMGPKSLYFFNHPDHAKHVLADNAANYHKGMGLTEAKRLLGEGLLTSEGELWRRQRRTIQPAALHQRHQREDASLALIVGLDDDEVILDGDDDDKRPEDERQDAEHVARGDGDRVLSVEGFAQRVQGTGADVAIHHAQRAERERREVAAPGSLLAGGSVRHTSRGILHPGASGSCQE